MLGVGWLKKRLFGPAKAQTAVTAQPAAAPQAAAAQSQAPAQKPKGPKPWMATLFGLAVLGIFATLVYTMASIIEAQKKPRELKAAAPIMRVTAGGQFGEIEAPVGKFSPWLILNPGMCITITKGPFFSQAFSEGEEQVMQAGSRDLPVHFEKIRFKSGFPDRPLTVTWSAFRCSPQKRAA